MLKSHCHPSINRKSLGSVQLLSHVQLFATPWTIARQASLSITNSGACSNSCPSKWWCHSTISSSVIPFSLCLQFFPASGSFPMSQFFASGGQSIGAPISIEHPISLLYFQLSISTSFFSVHFQMLSFIHGIISKHFNKMICLLNKKLFLILF